MMMLTRLIIFSVISRSRRDSVGGGVVAGFVRDLQKPTRFGGGGGFIRDLQSQKPTRFGRDSRISPTPLLDLVRQSCSTGVEISRFSDIYRKELVVSTTIKLFCFATHIHQLFFSNLLQIRITT